MKTEKNKISIVLFKNKISQNDKKIICRMKFVPTFAPVL